MRSLSLVARAVVSNASKTAIGSGPTKRPRGRRTDSAGVSRELDPIDGTDPIDRVHPLDRIDRTDLLVTGGIVAVTLAVYLRSLMPGIGFSGDAAKWQLLSEVGGVPHATGYPLYVALIQAFGFVVPFGSAAWRINLFSALCAVVATAMLYQLLRILGVRWVVAAATASTFAFTRTFWTQAVIAEVYTLHILFLVSIMVCLARWRLGGNGRWLLAGVALVALSFGNHLTTVLVVPSVLWLLWSDRRRALTPRNALWAVLLAGLAAGQYLYLLYMTSVGGYVESPVHDLGDIWNLVTGGPFKDEMLAFTPVELLRDRVPMLGRFLVQEYLVLLVPSAWGLVRGLRGWSPSPAAGAADRSGANGPDEDAAQGRRDRRDVAVALVLLGGGAALYGLNFDVLDVIVFFLPLFLVLAVFLGLGLDGIVAWVAARLPGHQLTTLGLAGTLLAIPVVTGLVDYRRASQRGTVDDAQRIERILDGVGEHAVLLTDNYDDSEFFWYFLIGERMAESRGLALVHEATPEQVQAYFTAGTGLVARAAAQVDGGGRPPLLTSSSGQADAMADAGLHVTEYGAGVWRVDEPQD